MQNAKIAFASLPKQANFLKNILLKNKALVKILNILAIKYRLPNWYIGGGAIPQIAWNYFHGFELNHRIDDYDIVYFDKNNLSKEAEEKKEAEIKNIFKKCPVRLEVVNEARTHLWYEQDFGKKIQPYSCTEEAIFSFPTTASATGVTLAQDKKMKIFAPHGLTDLLSLTVRANKIQISKEVYKKKCQRWKKVWPKLTIISWDY